MPSGIFPELEAAIVTARAHVTELNRRGALAGTDVTMGMHLAGYAALANAQRALAAARGEQYAH